jgi:hypothetical protein
MVSKYIVSVNAGQRIQSIAYPLQRCGNLVIWYVLHGLLGSSIHFTTLRPKNKEQRKEQAGEMAIVRSEKAAQSDKRCKQWSLRNRSE